MKLPHNIEKAIAAKYPEIQFSLREDENGNGKIRWVDRNNKLTRAQIKVALEEYRVLEKAEKKKYKKRRKLFGKRIEDKRLVKTIEAILDQFAVMETNGDKMSAKLLKVLDKYKEAEIDDGNDVLITNDELTELYEGDIK
jgi:flagellar motility protein MotE (MotC chaperone)